MQTSNLTDSAKTARKVCVAFGASSNQEVLSDIMRIIVEELRAFGIPDQSITVLGAADSQAKVPGEVGSTVIHDPANSPSLRLQEPNLDSPVDLNSALVSSDLKVLVGEFRPHGFLGFSGLSDIVFPGLASSASVQNHLTNRKGKSILDLYSERVQIAAALQNLFALGYVLSEEHVPARVAFGGFTDCVDSLKEFVENVCSCKIRKPADIVILSAGGWPMDESLLHAVESLPVGIAAVKRGGALILAAECEKGHGGGQFYEWSAERKESRHLEARVRHSFTYEGFKAAFLKRAVETHRVYLVSTIADYYVERVFGMRSAQTVNSALQAAQRAIGSNASITVIPNASRVTPSNTKNE